MLKSNKVNIALAVFIAVALWAYVLGEINPSSNDVVRNVPISFVNEESLEEEGLVVLSSSASSVNISISGQRTSVTRVDAGDFSVTADLEGLKLGENVVRLSVSGPGDVKIENVNVEKLTVVVDRRAAEEKDVEAVITGEADVNLQPHVVSVSADKATVSGPDTLVKQVRKVAVFVQAADLRDEERKFTCELVPVNERGERVEGVAIEGSATAEVTAIMFHKKTVSLDVPVINEDAGELERSFSAPKSIEIMGKASAIEEVSRISCRTVDLSQATRDSQIRLEPVLPEGVFLTPESEANLFLSLTVKPLAQKSFDFTEADVVINGKAESLKYALQPQSIKVTVSGREEDLAGLTAGDITLSVEAKDLRSGTHSLRLSVTCSKNGTEVTFEPDTVILIIE